MHSKLFNKLLLLLLPYCLQDAKRMMPQIDVAKALRNSPELVLSFQKGKHLIPYDEPWPIKKSSS
jgi:hypothetical protein